MAETTTAVAGLTLSADGRTLTVDSNYAGNEIFLNDMPSVVNVDASTAGSFSGTFTLYGNAQNNSLKGGSNTSNIMWGVSGNNTLQAGPLTDRFWYTGGGNDLIYFTPNMDGDRLYLGTPISWATRSGSTYTFGTPSGNTLVLATNNSGDYDQIYFTTDGGTNFMTAQIADVNATTVPYIGADLTAMSQPGTLVVWGSATESYTLDDGSVETFEGANHNVALNGAFGQTFVNVYNVDASKSFGNDIICGDANSNVIIEGGGNNSLWGGAGNDTLIGGTGADVFYFGKADGNDVVLNSRSVDRVNLYDVNLSDIVSTSENNGTIAVALNTGNVITVQSTEALSATFSLANGAAYRYNHATKAWQSA